MDNQTEQSAQPGSQPGHTDSDVADDVVTMTKAELNAFVEGKLKGSGKALKKAQEELEKYRLAAEQAAAKAEEERRAKLADSGKTAELLEIERREKEAAQTKIGELEAKWAAHVDRLTERNTARIKALPKEAQDLIPKQLDAEAVDEFIGKLEKLVIDKQTHVFGSGGAGARRSPESVWQKAEKIAANWTGKKGK